jgi:hypothetical protein
MSDGRPAAGSHASCTILVIIAWVSVAFDTPLIISGTAPSIAETYFHASWYPLGHGRLT